MSPVTLHHPVFVILAGVAAVGWVIYLSMMIFEHRSVLKEMGGRIR